MNAKRVLLIVGVAVLAAALILAGTAFAQSGWGDGDGWHSGHMNGLDDGHMADWEHMTDADHMAGWSQHQDEGFEDMMGPGTAHHEAMMSGYDRSQ